jgi:hypothetical protein
MESEPVALSSSSKMMKNWQARKKEGSNCFQKIFF